MGRIPWMEEGPFGLMVHWTQRTQPRAGLPQTDWNRRVDGFPVEQFAGEAEATGAKWLIFTVGHCGDFCSPNAGIEGVYPGHCSRRDLVADLGAALHRRGIRLIAYFQTEVMHENPAMRRAFGWDLDDKSSFQHRWTEVVRDYALRWGRAIDGWWFDSCYDMDQLNYFGKPRHSGFDNRRFGSGEAWLEAARAGNPDAVVAMNPGVAWLRHEGVLPEGEDYLAGESDTLEVRPEGPLQDGRQWHGLIWMDCRWGHFEGPGEIPPPRFCDDELYGYLSRCHEKGGAVTFNIGIYEDGGLAPGSAAQLRRLRDRLAGSGAPSRECTAAGALADDIRAAVQPSLRHLMFGKSRGASVDEYRERVRTGRWTEIRPSGGEGSGGESRAVTGEIWTDAIREALNRTGGAVLPRRERPYYLDGPIVLRPGQYLIAHPEAELRLMPGVDTCMVRNEGAAHPASDGAEPDSDIYIEGGVWTTLATGEGQCNGNRRGRADAAAGESSGHGVILMIHARRFIIRNLTVRQSAPFAIHIGDAREFLIENIRLDHNRRDGIHVQGSTRDGVIRHITGVTGDDFVALNAWEWANYAPCYGPIGRLLLEDIRPDGNGWDTLRLLPGVKRFPDGTRLECGISDIVLRRLRGIEWLFSVSQPNLELGRDVDFSDGMGRLDRIFIVDMRVTARPSGFAAAGSAPVRIHADTDGLTLDGVQMKLPPGEDTHLVEIGPLSLTYRPHGDDPRTWVEVYDPDLNCTVRNLRLRHVSLWKDGRWEEVSDTDALVRVVRQTVNADYPRTTPRGGTGRGIWLRDGGRE